MTVRVIAIVKEARTMIENIHDHMAKACECGCVRFNLLRSGAIECDDCQTKQPNLRWGIEMTLQHLLSMKVESKDMLGNLVNVPPEFRVSVQESDDVRGVRIIIHARGHNSETLDFWVKDNTLTPL